jgi:tRNA(Ile)-lysidine synthase
MEDGGHGRYKSPGGDGCVALARECVAGCGNSPAAVEKILETVEGSGGGAVCVACSGGSDSVYLCLHVIRRFPRLRGRLAILHFNHRLRGEDSDGDEKFVADFADGLGLWFRVGRLDNPPAKVSEAALRGRRNGFFERAMGELDSRILLLGHQRNDVAETLLMRLIRGSDTAGLAAPRAVTIFRDQCVKLRPLLDLSREEIVARLLADGVEWREDGSNRSDDFFRNRIRHGVLPAMRAAAGGFDVLSNLAKAKGNVEEADGAVEFFAQKYLVGRELKGAIAAEGLRILPRAVVKKIFARFLLINGIDIRRSRLECFLQRLAVNVPATFSLTGATSVHFDGKIFHLIGGREDGDWAVDGLKFGTSALPNGKFLRIERVELGDRWHGEDRGRTCHVAADGGGDFSAAAYRSNYRYARLGHATARKLGDLLPPKIISAAERRSLPVIFRGGRICWVPHLPVADFFRVKNGAKDALLLTYL